MAELVTEWNLSKYFYSSIHDENLKKDLELYKSQADTFIGKYKDNISTLSDSEFVLFLEEMDVLSVSVERVMVFLGLVSSLDTQNQEVQKELSKIHKTLSQYHEKFLFIDEEYKTMGWRKFEQLASWDGIVPFKNYLRNTGISLQYLLSELEERAIIKLETAYNSNLYDAFNILLSQEI